MSEIFKPLLIVTALGLAGCVSMPTGPSVAVMPGTGKSFDEFRFDEGTCRQYAYDQSGGQTAQTEQERAAVGSALLGTAIGAIAGAAFGGSSGAAVGAGVGLIGGSAVGADVGNASGYEAQRRYDISYTQCMYSKGHRVPMSGRMSPSARSGYRTPPPPPPGSPPPPPGGGW